MKRMIIGPFLADRDQNPQQGSQAAAGDNIPQPGAFQGGACDSMQQPSSVQASFMSRSPGNGEETRLHQPADQLDSGLHQSYQSNRSVDVQGQHQGQQQGQLPGQLPGQHQGQQQGQHQGQLPDQQQGQQGQHPGQHQFIQPPNLLDCAQNHSYQSYGSVDNPVPPTNMNDAEAGSIPQPGSVEHQAGPAPQHVHAQPSAEVDNTSISSFNSYRSVQPSS